MLTLMPSTFSLAIFAKYPLNTLTFGLFILTTMTLWAYKRFWIWVPLLAFTCTVAYYANIIGAGFAAPLIVLAICHLILSKQDLNSAIKVVVVTIATIVSFGLCFHLFPYVNNWLLAPNLQVSPDAPTFNYYWSFDKPFIGFFVLAFQIPLLHAYDWKRIALKTLVGAAAVIAFFIFVATTMSVVRPDFKLPVVLIPWLIGNLFLTVIPEEAFFRGFLLNRIADLFPLQHAKWVSNFIISLVFGAIHLFFVHNLAYFLLAFVASFVYGALYIKTRCIESAIFTHYALNVVHFIFFTYPILVHV